MTRDVGPAKLDKSEVNPVDHWREVERAARDELRRRADAAFEEIVAILKQHANSLDVAQKARIRSLLKR